MSAERQESTARPARTAPAGSLELSVITVTHGRLELLQRKLAALSAQTIDPNRFEWCVVANGDVQAAAWLAEQRPPFALRLRSESINEPVARARNLAAALAGGSYLLLSDDDVLPSPGCLGAHLEAHAQHAGAGAADSRAVVIGDLRLSEEHRAPGVKEPFEERLLQAGPGLWINVTGANTSLPRSAFEAVGGFDESFAAYGGEDSDLGYRLRARALRFRRSAAAWATHVGSVLADTDKAFAAGRAGVRVWRKHGSFDVAVMLGVHPLLLALKRAWLRSPAARGMARERRAYEEAYLQGASAELGEPAPTPTGEDREVAGG